MPKLLNGSKAGIQTLALVLAESGILPLSYRAPQRPADIATTDQNLLAQRDPYKVTLS